VRCTGPAILLDMAGLDRLNGWAADYPILFG
jgi:hypothetical protein